LVVLLFIFKVPGSRATSYLATSVPPTAPVP
jgi:hypothetical protein